MELDDQIKAVERIRAGFLKEANRLKTDGNPLGEQLAKADAETMTHVASTLKTFRTLGRTLKRTLDSVGAEPPKPKPKQLEPICDCGKPAPFSEEDDCYHCPVCDYLHHPERP